MPHPTLFLIDGSSQMYRAYHAPVRTAEGGLLRNAQGRPTNAVYIFVTMLRKLIADHHPEYIAASFDLPGRTFRDDLVDDYKANRTPMPDELAEQIPMVHAACEALGVPILTSERYEADDVIGTLATREPGPIEVATGDRDLFQVIDDARSVVVLYCGKGVAKLEVMDGAVLHGRYGVGPSGYADFAALRGDPSDNLPGIPGVGEKTATKWIAEFGSLAALVDRVDEVKGKAGDALREHLGSVLRNRQLTALVTDLPAETVGAVPGDLLPVAWDREKIHRLFDTLEFKVLRERLYQTLPHGLIGATGPGGPQDTAAPHPEKAAFEVVADLLGPDQVGAWLAAHESAERSGLTLTGTWGRGTGNVTAMAIAAPDGHGAHLDPVQLTDADERALAAWLADPAHPKVLHDAKGQMHALAARGLPLAGLACDTAIAAYLALPGQRTFDLADLALRYLGKELREEADDGQLTLDGSGERDAAGALVLRAQATLELAAALEEDLGRRESVALLHDLELPLIDVLAEMERTGIAADIEHFSVMSAMLHGEAKAAEQAAYAAAGHEFNLGSPKQLQELLFNELHLPKTRRIKTG
ncbi:MAG: DNA polymerase I, partial [Acidobacteria bacterium]